MALKMDLKQEQEFISDFISGRISNEEFLNQYYKLIRFFIWKKCNPQAAEDCFQDCCIELFNLAKEYDSTRETKFSTFLLSQLRAIVTKHNRELAREKHNRSLECLMERGFDTADFQSEIEVNFFSDRLRDAIAILTEREKKLIYYYYFQDYTLRTISGLLGIKYGSVGYELNKAVKKMSIAFKMRDEFDKILEGV